MTPFDLYFLFPSAMTNLSTLPLSTKIDLLIFLNPWLPCTQRPPGERSDVGLLVDEYRAAGEGSIHFDLLLVAHGDQHVVLQFVEHLRGETRLLLEISDTYSVQMMIIQLCPLKFNRTSAFSQMSLEETGCKAIICLGIKNLPFYIKDY